MHAHFGGPRGSISWGMSPGALAHIGGFSNPHPCGWVREEFARMAYGRAVDAQMAAPVQYQEVPSQPVPQRVLPPEDIWLHSEGSYPDESAGVVRVNPGEAVVIEWSHAVVGSVLRVFGLKQTVAEPDHVEYSHEIKSKSGMTVWYVPTHIMWGRVRKPPHEIFKVAVGSEIHGAILVGQAVLQTPIALTKYQARNREGAVMANQTAMTFLLRASERLTAEPETANKRDMAIAMFRVIAYGEFSKALKFGYRSRMRTVALDGPGEGQIISDYLKMICGICTEDELSEHLQDLVHPSQECQGFTLDQQNSIPLSFTPTEAHIEHGSAIAETIMKHYQDLRSAQAWTTLSQAFSQSGCATQ